MLQVLTPAQEAYLDCQCHPWCPDLWAMAGLLAEHQPGEPSRAAEAALLPACKLGQPEAAGSSEKERAKGVSLQMGAFGLLRAPLLGRGAGLSLKRKPICPCANARLVECFLYGQLLGRLWHNIIWFLTYSSTYSSWRAYEAGR